MNNLHSKEQIKLIALWAFCESGLGGILHAMRLPFTGFVVGGFACIILLLLARVSKHKPYQILEATLVVLAIKFMASPHSPLPAYLAVGFQGLFAFLVFNFFGLNLFTAILFSSLALLESALQKFLLTTLIYGKSFWEALDIFLNGIIKEFGLEAASNPGYHLVGLYCGIYFCWGIYLGVKGFYYPQHLQNLANSLPSIATLPVITPQKKKLGFGTYLKWLSVPFTVLLILLTFYFTEGTLHKGFLVLARAMFIILIVYFVLNPIIRYWLARNLHKQQQGGLFALVQTELLYTRKLSSHAWTLSATRRGLPRLWLFMHVLLALSLYPQHD